MHASSTAGCHPLYEEQWEGGEALATCFMTKLAHNCPLSFPSSALSPPCSRPVISFLLISFTKVPVSSLCQSLFLSFPSPYLTSHPFSVPCVQSLCCAFPALAYYSPFLCLKCHLLPIQLRLLIPYPLHLVQFRQQHPYSPGSVGSRDVVRTSPGLSDLAKHAISGEVLSFPALGHALSSYFTQAKKKPPKLHVQALLNM